MNGSAIRLHDLDFEPFLSEAVIEQAISQMAEAMNRDFAGKQVVILGILDGAFMTVSDLVKKLDLDLQVEFVKLKSYEGQHTTGAVNQLLGLSSNLKDKHVVVVEDIIDTGQTVSHLVELLKTKNPADICLASLLVKTAIFQNKFPVSYTGLSIPNKFVVGYGMDYNGAGRHLPDIYAVNQ